MATDIIAPIEQEGTKSVLKVWLKGIGDPVRADEPVAELETDKVAVEIAAPCDGVLAEILIGPDTDVEPGAVLGRVAEVGPAVAVQSAPRESGAKATASPPRVLAAADSEERLSPSVRRLLLEHNLDPRLISGTGQGGRVTRVDVDAALASRAPASAEETAGVARIPHDSMRRRIAEHMVHSTRTAPHVTAMFEADFSTIMAHREAHKAEFEANGVSLTFSAYFVAASAAAMKAAPAVNGRWFDDHIEIHDDVNIGVGTALGDKGLVVPVVHRAQKLSLFEIAQSLQLLVGKARSGKLAPADVRGGTFSISNHGTSGSLLAAPIIINQPQAAILGIGKVQKRAVVREAGGIDKIDIRPMAYVTLTIDHRMLDGHQTNTWLTRFVDVLESWKD